MSGAGEPSNGANRMSKAFCQSLPFSHALITWFRVLGFRDLTPEGFWGFGWQDWGLSDRVEDSQGLGLRI